MTLKDKDVKYKAIIFERMNFSLIFQKTPQN